MDICMMPLRGYQLHEPILKFIFSCVYDLLCISTLGCICHTSILTVKMKVIGFSWLCTFCAFSSMEFWKPDFSCDQNRSFEIEHKILKCCRFHCEYEDVIFWSDVSLLGNVDSPVMWYFCYCATRKTVLKQTTSNNKWDYFLWKMNLS